MVQARREARRAASAFCLLAGGTRCSGRTASQQLLSKLERLVRWRALPVGASSLGTAHSHASASCWRSPSWPSIQALVPLKSAAEGRGRSGCAAVLSLAWVVSQQAWPGAAAARMPSSARSASEQRCLCGWEGRGGACSGSVRGEGSSGGWWGSVGVAGRWEVGGSLKQLKSRWRRLAPVSCH